MVATVRPKRRRPKAPSSIPSNCPPFNFGPDAASAVWLLRADGWRLARATATVTLLLSTIEVTQIIQIHLPGRVAGIADPLLALAMAATLPLLDRKRDSFCHGKGSP